MEIKVPENTNEILLILGSDIEQDQKIIFISYLGHRYTIEKETTDGDQSFAEFYDKDYELIEICVLSDFTPLYGR